MRRVEEEEKKKGNGESSKIATLTANSIDFFWADLTNPTVLNDI